MVIGVGDSILISESVGRACFYRVQMATMRGVIQNNMLKLFVLCLGV